MGTSSISASRRDKCRQKRIDAPHWLESSRCKRWFRWSRSLRTSKRPLRYKSRGFSLSIISRQLSDVQGVPKAVSGPCFRLLYIDGHNDQPAFSSGATPPAARSPKRKNSEDLHETISLDAAFTARVFALSRSGIFIRRSVYQHQHCTAGAARLCSAAVPYRWVHVDARLLGL